MNHKVKINLPSGPATQPPNPNEPLITVDGKEFKHIQSIRIEASGRALTEVTLCFMAEVEGVLEVQELRLPK